MEPGVSVSARKPAPFPHGGFQLAKLRLKGVVSCTPSPHPPKKAVQITNAKAPGLGCRQAITCCAGRRPIEVRRARAHARWAGEPGGGELPRQVAESRHSPQGPAPRRRGRGLALSPSLPAPTGLVPPSCTLSGAARRPPHLLRSCSTGKGSAKRSQAR